MKKIFPLHVEGAPDPKVVSAAKVEISRYLKRERRKALPESVDFWDFQCRVGPNREEAPATHVSSIPAAVDAAAQSGAPEVYVEILAIHGHRTKKAKNPSVDLPLGEVEAPKREPS